MHILSEIQILTSLSIFYKESSGWDIAQQEQQPCFPQDVVHLNLVDSEVRKRLQLQTLPGRRRHSQEQLSVRLIEV